jgi:predicted ester cyclase
MQPLDVVTRFLDLMDRRDPSAYDLVAEDFVQHAAGPQGRDGFAATLSILDHDLDRPTEEHHHTFAAGDLVCVHLTLHGTHADSTMPLLQGVPPTGKPVAWRFIHIFRVADGRIVEHWACRDDVGLLAQVGGWPVSN